MGYLFIYIAALMVCRKMKKVCGKKVLSFLIRHCLPSQQQLHVVLSHSIVRSDRQYISNIMWLIVDSKSRTGILQIQVSAGGKGNPKKCYKTACQ